MVISICLGRASGVEHWPTPNIAYVKYRKVQGLHPRTSREENKIVDA